MTTDPGHHGAYLDEELDYLLQAARPHARRLILTSALIALQSMAFLAMPWLAGKLTVALLEPAISGTTTLNAVVAMLVGFLAIQNIIAIAVGHLAVVTHEQLVRAQRLRIYDHLIALPVAFHQSARRGDLLALMSADAEEVSGFLAGGLTTLAPLLLTFAGAAVLMLNIEPRLGAAALIVLPLFAVGAHWLVRLVRPLSRELAAARAASLAIAEEHLRLLPVIRAFTGEKRARADYAASVDRTQQLNKRVALVLNQLRPITQFASAAALVGLCWFAARMVTTGELSAGELVSFLLYGLLLTRPVSEFAGLYGQVQRTRASAARLASVLRLNRERETPLSDFRCDEGQVEFQDVSFSYPDRPDALCNVTLNIKPGETLVVTGRNGSGKSTLGLLLAGFWQPSMGRILIDGTDIAMLNLHCLRSQVTLVAQTPLLFDASILDNIALGDPSADFNDIETAARAAQAHDFIRLLPEGYNTRIGEQGVLLSGGQQQRLALARALLRGTPIIVLDEPTAMFDALGESRFFEDFPTLFAGKTTILVSHAPVKITFPHQQVTLNCGRISGAAA